MGWKVLFGEIKTKEGPPDDDGNPTFERYSDTEVHFDDFTPGAFDAIAKDVDTTFNYMGIYAFPKETSEIAWRVVCAAAEKAGIPAPPRPETMREQRELDRMLERTPDISEQPMLDGNPPMPGKTPDSSSTSPGNTTGPEPSPEPNPSDGS